MTEVQEWKHERPARRTCTPPALIVLELGFPGPEMTEYAESRSDVSSERYVRCPLCPWRCLHHGKRADGCPVSWRLPADEPYSGRTDDRAFVKQFYLMRAHVRGHEVNLKGSAGDLARVRLAMAFIPSRHKKVPGNTNEERARERQKRYRPIKREDCRRRRKLARNERQRAKILEVCGSCACAWTCVSHSIHTMRCHFVTSGTVAFSFTYAAFCLCNKTTSPCFCVFPGTTANDQRRSRWQGFQPTS